MQRDQLTGVPSITERSHPVRRHRRSDRKMAGRVMILAVAAASAVAGGLSGVHPTGTPIVDPLYGASIGAIVPLACSIAKRWTWLILAGGAAVLSRDWLIVPVWVALLGALVLNLRPRGDRRAGALIGALAIQVALRWPHVGFQGCTALVGVIVVAPCLLSGYARCRGQVRVVVEWAARMLLAILLVAIIPILVGGLWASRDVSRGLAASQGAIADVSTGTTFGAQAELLAASTHFADAHNSTSGWWTAASRLLPIVAQQRQAVAKTTAIGRQVTAIAAAEAGHVDYGGLHFQGGGINLKALAQLTGPLKVLNAAVTSADTQLGSISNPWLIHAVSARVARFHKELATAAKNTALAAVASSHLPAILGADGTRHYLVALETPSESRGLGGYIGSYAELAIANGRVSLTRAGSTAAELDDTNLAGRHITGPPTFIARYGSFPHITSYFGNLSVSPDLPTTTDVVSQIYAQAGGDHLDGVLAIDPYGLAALLEFTGPISVPGVPIVLTSSNTANFLLKQQYVEFANNDGTVRHDYLTEVLKVAFSRLISRSLPDPRTLSADLDPAVNEGRILFWSDHVQDQSLIEQVHMSGAFPSADGGDLLSVVTQNQANNKIDAYLHRTITDKVVINPATGHVDDTITINLQNNAPSSGLPSYVIGSYAGSGFPEGTNFLSLTIYSPLTLLTATEDGANFPFGHQHEFGVSTYTTADFLTSGASDTFVLHLTGTVSTRGDYQMTLHQQPLVNRDAGMLQLTPTQGWFVAGYPTGIKWTFGTGADEIMSARFERIRT
jgi:hypothetical protein